MAYSTINKQTSHFNTLAYSGTGSSQALTGVGFKPDLVWIKQRTGTTEHLLFDVIRGVTKALNSNDATAEDTISNSLTAFGTDGFTVNGNASSNAGSGSTYAAWNWLAGGSAGSSNTAGSINTTYTSVNTTAGFSISTYTGNGTSGATVGHGLGAVPQIIWVKALTGSNNWACYHVSIGATKYFRLNTNDAAATSTARWNDTAPTSSVFSIGNDGEVNTNGVPYVAYCWAPKIGFSKFGKYTSNNNVNGAFVYTGFKPNWIVIKSIGSGGYNFMLFDTVRKSVNINGTTLQPDSTAAEFDYAENGYVDFLSNGFKVRSTSNGVNGSGATEYSYMAIGQTLVGTNNIPATAR